MTAAKEIPTPAPEPVLREDQVDYTPTARSVSLSRHRAARLVLQWGHPLMAGDVALVVSELATNSVMHGAVRGRLFRVHLTLTEFVLRVAVSDPRGERLPRLGRPGDDECFGRGLLIVAQLADRWGVEQRDIGKTVFAELSVR